MRSVFFRVFAAVALFAGVHSMLALRAAKQFAAERFGARNRAGLYRPFFIVQSFVTAAALLAYLARLPDRPLYALRGFSAMLLRLGQVGGWFIATAAAWQVGLARISGLAPLQAWLRGDQHVDPEPEAQGPAPDRDTPRPVRLDTRGPFQISRHPLNLSPLPIFWLTPRMTLKRLAFNLAATLYLVLGSYHEESRLLAAYGDAYHRYRKSGVPFYL